MIRTLNLVWRYCLSLKGQSFRVFGIPRQRVLFLCWMRGYVQVTKPFWALLDTHIPTLIFSYDVRRDYLPSVNDSLVPYPGRFFVPEIRLSDLRVHDKTDR